MQTVHENLIKTHCIYQQTENRWQDHDTKDEYIFIVKNAYLQRLEPKFVLIYLNIVRQIID